MSKDALNPQLSLTVGGQKVEICQMAAEVGSFLKARHVCNMSRGEAEQQAGSVCSTGV